MSIKPEVHLQEEWPSLKEEQVLALFKQKYAGANILDLRQSYAQTITQKLKISLEDLKIGAAVFFPFTNLLVIYPEEKILYQAQTLAQSSFFTEKDQDVFRRTPILVVGLSVGASIVSLLFEMGARNLFGFDNDVIDPSNLNRLPLGFLPGIAKAELLAHLTTLTDPYHHSFFEKEKITRNNIEQIFNRYCPEIIIDECDSPETKLLLRKEAKKRGLVVFSVTDTGVGSVQFTYENYKEDSELGVLNTRLGKRQVSEEEWLKLPSLVQKSFFVELADLPKEMGEAVELLMNGSMIFIPQEGVAAAYAAATMTRAIQLYLTGTPIKSYQSSYLADQLLLNKKTPAVSSRALSKISALVSNSQAVP